MRSLFNRLDDVFGKAFWGSIVTLAVIFVSFSIFVFKFQEPLLNLGFLVLLIAIIGIFSFRSQKLVLDRKTIEIHEANRIHLATVEALATAIDARDQVGSGHVNRTQIYAVRTGEMLGLPKAELEALRTAALLHDIGKLAVPDHILNKPGRLTPAELEKTKIHASVGASILSGIEFPYPVAPTVRFHHERWDGSGYPDRLKGTEIPLTARILSVADAYDTLRGSRPYRPPVSKEEAIRFIEKGAGTRFDPAIADTFLKNLETLEAEIEWAGLSYRNEPNALEAFRSFGAFDHNSSYVEQIKRANREVYTLYELARVFGTSLNLDDTLSLFTSKISELVPFDTCVVYLLNDTETVAIAKHAVGMNSEALKNRKLRIGQGATGYTLDKRIPVSNISPALDFSFYQMEFVESYSSMASLPLIANERLLGAVSLYSCELAKYEEEHMRLLETVARIASDAIYSSVTHAETEEKALTDPLTGLPNARSLQVEFEKEIARANRSGSKFQVLMIDLDGFKAVNDNLGHRAGDRFLREIANVMMGELRDYDFLARYAGDEFVAIIPETDNEAVFELSQRIERAVRGYEFKAEGGKTASVGVSIGAAAYPAAGESIDQIVIAADKAMYAVKANHKLMLNGDADFEMAADGDVAEPAYDISTEPLEDRITEAAEDLPQDEGLLVELDESHVISSEAVN